jgi:hypothetical protein
VNRPALVREALREHLRQARTKDREAADRAGYGRRIAQLSAAPMRAVCVAIAFSARL